ncbi:MAG: IclR family transcriptional regulator [Desulfosarcinaceae bacterium]
MNINPLVKVFSVIETVVAGQAKGMTYSEILAALDLPKSSVHRILKELTDIGYLNFNPETKKYFGSLRLAGLGAEVMAHFQLRDYIHPHLLELHRETEHTTNMGVLDGTRGIFVDKIESKDFGIKLFSEIGKTFPLHCTGLGKVLLAFSHQDVLSELLQSPLEAITERTITSAGLLRQEMKSIRELGYALDDEEITRGIMCLAAPVYGFDQGLVGAISLTFPTYINNDRGIDPEIDAIRKYSSLISRSLGGG